MNPKSASVFVFLLVALLIAYGCQSVQERQPKYKLGVTAEQSDVDDGVFCRFQFTNADTGEVISSPTVLAQWNEPAEITQTTKTDVLTISVLADRAEQTVAYSALLTSGKDIQFEKKDEVKVAPAAS